MSNLFTYIINTSETHEVEVLVTAQRTTNDNNGNPRYLLQVWVKRENGGNLWTPKVKGYRINKNDQYIVSSYNINEDIQDFMNAFEKAVYVK